MIRPLITFRRKRVVIDIDTQKDFLLSSGKACIRNHRRVLANIRRIMAWARANKFRIISTVEIHSNGNGNGNGKSVCCLEGTEGQKKIRYTLRNKRISFAADGCTDLPKNLLADYDQIILHKRCSDPFDEPRAERVLSEIRADELILIGSNMDGAVKSTALGLLQRGKKVTIVTDAIGSQEKNDAEVSLRQIQAKGGKLVETKKLAGASCLHAVGACDCPRCHPAEDDSKISQESFSV